jgi:ribosomal protein S18 acetylase RimI-like enzyme
MNDPRRARAASPIVRPATAEDYPAVARLSVDAYEADGQLVASTHYAPVLADVAGRAVDTEVLVAVSGEAGQVVGAVSFVRPGSRYAELAGPDEAEFRMLAVDPAAQGTGVGEALVRACITRAGEVGARAIVICTRDFAVRAHRLYAKLGFVRVPEQDWSPLPGVSLLALRRVIGHLDQVESDLEGGDPALLVGDVGIADHEPGGVQREDRQ